MFARRIARRLASAVAYRFGRAPGSPWTEEDGNGGGNDPDPPPLNAPTDLAAEYIEALA